MKIKHILLFALLASAFSGCRRGDDLYTNPNAPVVASPQTMLVAIEANTFMNHEGGLARIASIMVQHNSGVSAQYISTDMYDLQESDMDNYWGGLYVGAMKNSQLLFKTYEAKDPYYGGISKVIMAMNLGIATDLWGDVPYNEAFQLETGLSQPHYDPQASILNDIQALLDQAIADFAKPTSANGLLPGADDQIFGGNIGAWVKTAWTLKARYHNRLSKRDPSGSATSVLADLASAAMTSNLDNCYSKHYSSDQNQWAAFQNQRGQNVLACKTLIDSLGNVAGDHRTAYYFDTTGHGNMAAGNPLGQSLVTVSQWGPYLNNVAGSTPLVTYAEQQFVLAEAQARLGNMAAAAAALDTAINANVMDVTAGAYITGSASYTAANVTIHKIITEKWKAMFAQPIEAYSDYRRTGFPQLTVRPLGVRNYIPRRFPTALGERTNNANAPVVPLNVDVWYAQ